MEPSLRIVKIIEIKFHHTLIFITYFTKYFFNVCLLSSSSYAHITSKLFPLCFKKLLINPIALLMTSSVALITVNDWIQVVEIREKTTWASKGYFVEVLICADFEIRGWVEGEFVATDNSLPVPKVTNSILWNCIPVQALVDLTFRDVKLKLHLSTITAFKNRISLHASTKCNSIDASSHLFFHKLILLQLNFSFCLIYPFEYITIILPYVLKDLIVLLRFDVKPSIGPWFCFICCFVSLNEIFIHR